MHVLIITQLFNPEMGAATRRLESIVKQLTASGHTVSVATGMPNYPSGIVHPEYRGKRFMQEQINGATVFRTHYYTVPRNKSQIEQLRSYLSMIPAQFNSGLKAGRADIVFVTSPPLFSVLPGIWLTKIWKSKLVLDLRDLWPDEFVACGIAAEGSPKIRIMRRIEQMGYRTASCIPCTTHAFMDTVVGRGVPRSKTLFMPNGADTEFFRPMPRDNKVAAEYNFGTRFVVMYSGVMGIKHNLKRLLDAAELLKEHRDIVFFIRGSGPTKASLEERVRESKIENVLFGDERDLADIPHLIARADVCVTALLPDAYLDKIISVKIFEYLACERPVIAALGGESARVITEGNGGIIVPQSDPQAMADAILKLYNDPELRIQMGKNGRRFICEHYTRSVAAARLEKRLRELQGESTVQTAVA